MTSKYRACPFCGGHVDPAGWLNGDGERGPECETCGATAPSIQRWNTRISGELLALTDLPQPHYNRADNIMEMSPDDWANVRIAFGYMSQRLKELGDL